MYLKKLYHHSKTACVIVVLLCLVQFVISYKQGAVATPFLNYGMYSNKISPMPEYEVYKIYADGVLLKGGDFSIQYWDKIYLPLYMYLQKDTVNTEMVDIKNRLLTKIKLKTILPGDDLFINENFGDTDFKNWYTQYISSILNKNVQEVKIIKQRYIWNAGYLQPADSVILFQL